MSKARDLADGTFDTDTLVVDAANNLVGIGTSSPATSYGKALHIHNDTTTGSNLRLTNSTSGSATGNGFEIVQIGADDYIINREAGSMIFYTNNTEVMRLDASQNLLVGTTDTSLYNNTSGGGMAYRPGNELTIAAATNPQFIVNNTGSDGEMIRLALDGSTKGSLGVEDNNLVVDGGVNSGFRFFSTSVRPRQNGALIDNVVDMGGASHRFDDIYATNTTIQTSDANEKQDIEELDEAEKRVATAAKGLIRKFRWIDAVAEKGDDARIHVGVIAQDLQAAFEAEGLDAGCYAMFISSTWWEATETYTDDDGVKQTRVNTYETAEEAPEGAVERTRLGVRYSELLAFIIGAL